MSCSVKVFSTPFELAEALAFDLVNKIKETGKRKSPFTVAIPRTGLKMSEFLLTKASSSSCNLTCKAD